MISLSMSSYDLYISLIFMLTSYKYCLSPLNVDDALINRPLHFINTAIHHCDPGCSTISPVTALIRAGDRKQSGCTSG